MFYYIYIYIYTQNILLYFFLQKYLSANFNGQANNVSFS